MRAVARSVDYASCPPAVAMYANPEQVHLKPGSDYTVHALAVFGEITHFQVVDELGYPSWKPSWLFDLSDPTLPEDWVCGVFPDGDPQLILGPAFLARDHDAYSRMVEMDAEQVRRFWERLDRLREEETSELFPS